MVCIDMEKFEDLTKLSQKIIKSHPDGYCGALVDGARGSGKTTFCMHTMREVYQYLDGIDRVDAWNKVLSKIFFTMNDVINALKIVEQIDMDNVIDSQREFMIPVVCWDDAGMHGGRLKHFIDMKLADRLNSVMDTARDVVSGFLINAPEREGLLSFIRRYRDNLWITIGYPETRGDKYKRLAIARRYYIDKLGRRRNRIIFQTRFSCYVEKWVYEEYKKKKITAVKEALRHLEALANRKKNIEVIKYEADTTD